MTHAFYVIGSYVLTAAICLSLAVWIYLDGRARQAELDDLFADREPDYDHGWPLDLPEPRGSIHSLTDEDFRQVYGEEPIPPLDGRRRRR